MTTGYSHLTDAELAKQARLAHDPLTATALQTELTTRFELAVESLSALAPIAEILDDSHIDLKRSKDIERVKRALENIDDSGITDDLMAVLGDFDLDSPKLLREQLQRLATFDQAIQDLVDPITQLQTLVTTE